MSKTNSKHYSKGDTQAQIKKKKTGAWIDSDFRHRKIADKVHKKKWKSWVFQQTLSAFQYLFRCLSSRTRFYKLVNTGKIISPTEL